MQKYLSLKYFILVINIFVLFIYKCRNTLCDSTLDIQCPELCMNCYLNSCNSDLFSTPDKPMQDNIKFPVLLSVLMYTHFTFSQLLSFFISFPIFSAAWLHVKFSSVWMWIFVFDVNHVCDKSMSWLNQCHVMF